MGQPLKHPFQNDLAKVSGREKLAYKVSLLENELQGLRDTATGSSSQVVGIDAATLVILANISKTSSPRVSEAQIRATRGY